MVTQTLKIFQQMLGDFKVCLTILGRYALKELMVGILHLT